MRTFAAEQPSSSKRLNPRTPGEDDLLDFEVVEDKEYVRTFTRPYRGDIDFETQCV